MAAITPPSEIAGDERSTGHRAGKLRRRVGLALFGDQAGGDALDRPLLPFEVCGTDAVAEIDVVGRHEDVRGSDGRFDPLNLGRMGDDDPRNPSGAKRRRDGDGEDDNPCSFHDRLILSNAPRPRRLVSL